MDKPGICGHHLSVSKKRERTANARERKRATPGAAADILGGTFRKRRLLLLLLLKWSESVTLRPGQLCAAVGDTVAFWSTDVERGERG